MSERDQELVQAWDDWRAGFYVQLMVVETDALETLANSMERALDRIRQELDARMAAAAG